MHFVRFLFIVLLAMPVLGRSACNKNKLVGKWTVVGGLPLNLTNIDSVMATMDTSSIGYGWETFNFKDDGTYDVWEPGLVKGMNSDTTILEERKGHYSVVEDDCEIWFKKKPHHGQVWHILFLNEKFLVFKYRNPKHVEVVVYRRK